MVLKARQAANTFNFHHRQEVMYPRQNRWASKLATHHCQKHQPRQVLFATKSADGGRNPPAVDEITS